MKINELPFIGQLNPYPSDTYNYKWLVVLNDDSIIESKFCNQKSYYNKDGFDSVSWTQTVKNNSIKELQLIARKDNQEFNCFTVSFDRVKSLSYSMIQWNSGYILIVGITIEMQSGEILEFLTNGTILKR